jgi:beta-fructofuranosidase
MYFQYCPDTRKREPMVWGHATSPDLIRWRVHAPAITPHSDGLDRDGCWSGNTVLRDSQVVAYYTGYRTDQPLQHILSAVSSDGGWSFAAPRQVVDAQALGDPLAFFRDPFVWADGDQLCMAVGAGDVDGNPSVQLYRSTSGPGADAMTWRHAGPLLSGHDLEEPTVELGHMWECPQLVSLPGGEALLVGTWSPQRWIGQVLALIAGHDTDSPSGVSVAPLDHGPNFYAPSALREGPDGPLVWGWITEGRDAPWAVEGDWSGSISLPRTLRLSNLRGLHVAPLEAVTSLRQEQHTFRALNSHTLSADQVSAQFELDLQLHASGHRGTTRIMLACSADERLGLVVDWDAGTITIDRRHASNDDRGHRSTHTFADSDARGGTVRLRLFIDGSIGELFTSSGASATFRFYPLSPPPWTLRIVGAAEVTAVQLWKLTRLC